MKHKFWTTVALVAMIAGAATVAFLDNQTEKANLGCEKRGTAYTVAIHDNVATPGSIDAKRCDTLTITNHDNKTREMAFGIHDKHVSYDGVTEKSISQGESFTVTLNQTGTFVYHDHIEDEVGGRFTVSK